MGTAISNTAPHGINSRARRTNLDINLKLAIASENEKKLSACFKARVFGSSPIKQTVEDRTHYLIPRKLCVT